MTKTWLYGLAGLVGFVAGVVLRGARLVHLQTDTSEENRPVALAVFAFNGGIGSNVNVNLHIIRRDTDSTDSNDDSSEEDRTESDE